MSITCKLFPAKLDFPPATQDVCQLSGDETVIRLTANSVGFDQLASHATVQILWCSRIDRERLEVLSRCEQLEALYIEDIRVQHLEPLGALDKLDVLGVDGATKVGKLDWLGQVRPLSQLRLQGLPRVSSLEGLTAQDGLKMLDVSGSMWTRMKVASFACLSELQKLRSLYLTNIQSLDGSLRMLADLPHLVDLHIAQFYDWTEFAQLAGLRPDVRCDSFEPFSESAGEKCDACGTELVMLTGKRQPTICPKCKASRFLNHVERFSDAAKKAAQQSGATDHPNR